jgi:hypothetical protein
MSKNRKRIKKLKKQVKGLGENQMKVYSQFRDLDRRMLAHREGLDELYGRVEGLQADVSNLLQPQNTAQLGEGYGDLKPRHSSDEQEFQPPIHPHHPEFNLRRDK